MTRGVEVYPRIVSIVADKPDGQRYEHRFTRRAAIIGKSDGSLSIRAHGARLHKMFKQGGKNVPYLINPPRRRRNKKNPLLQILSAGNPPRRKKMRTGKMPPALARYWAKHSRKKRANPKRRRRVRKNTWAEKRQYLTIRDYHRAPRHRKAAILGSNRRHQKRLKSRLGVSFGSSGDSTMARHRKHRRRRVASNPVRHHTNYRRRSHRRRHNPPMRLGGVGVASLAQQAAGVAVGIIAPTMIMKAPIIPASLQDSPLKRVAVKLAVGLGVSMAGRKFVNRGFGNMILIGVAANILMADIFPKLLPQTGVGLAEGYQDLPMLSGGYNQGHAGWEQYRADVGEFPSEGMGEFPSEASNVNEFAAG